MKFTPKTAILTGLLCAGLYTIPLLTINGDLFLKSDNFDGGLKGESTEPGFEGWIEVDSFQFGAGNPVSTDFGSPNRSGTPSLTEITLSKTMDSTSPALFANLTQGERIPVMRVVLRLGSRTFKYIIEDVYISSVSWSSGGLDGSESLSLNFRTITVEHYSVDEKGGEILTGSASWNRATQTTK